jgi:hypothetical protein
VTKMRLQKHDLRSTQQHINHRHHIQPARSLGLRQRQVDKARRREQAVRKFKSKLSTSVNRAAKQAADKRSLQCSHVSAASE